MIEYTAKRIAPAVRRFRWRDETGPLTHAQVLDLLHRAGEEAELFSAMMLEPGFDAVFWEMPPLHAGSLDRPFECVVVDAPALARMASNPGPFRAHFRGPDTVVAFDNLGADAHLVAPSPAGDADYAHLAAFCRNASRDVQRQFWSVLAAAVMQRLGAKPVWVSTSGLGVGWLHARIDTRPKYYTHAPYRHRF